MAASNSSDSPEPSLVGGPVAGVLRIPVFHFTPVQKGLRRFGAAAVALVYGMAIGLFSAKTWAGLTSAAAAPFGHLLGFNGQ